MFRIVLLCLALTTPPVSGAEVESGIDRPGNDYKRIEMAPSITRFGQCQAACASDPKCKAWTFVKSGVQGPKAQCYLKSSVPNAFGNNCCTSGVKGGGKPVRVTGRKKVTSEPQELERIRQDKEMKERIGKNVDATAEKHRKLLDCIADNSRC